MHSNYAEIPSLNGIVDLSDYAFDKDVARTRRLQAGQDLDQRRLAGAVRPQQAKRFAAIDVEAHPVQCCGRSKALSHIANLDQSDWRFRRHTVAGTRIRNAHLRASIHGDFDTSGVTRPGSF